MDHYEFSFEEKEIQHHQIDINFLFGKYSIDYNDMALVYGRMITCRCFDEESYKNYNKMRGFLHLTIGQESIYGVLSLFVKDFDFITTYRCHSLALITGSSVKEVAGELLGNSEGMCKGKGGSMHLYNSNFLGGHGIVGAQVPLGTGMAFAIKYAQSFPKNPSMNHLINKKGVFVFLGDGAANQGQVYESYNLALLHNLPVVYVIENNQYGMWTKLDDVSPSDNLYKRWSEMPGIRIKDDINSLYVVFSKISDGSLKMPLVLQIDTYRHCGHSMNDAERYRTEEEKTKEKNNDCLIKMKNILNGLNLCKHESCISEPEAHDLDLEAFQERVITKIKEDFQDVIHARLPNDDELFTDVYK